MRALLAVACLALPVTAAAHFRLMSPASATQQNAYGDPQKTAPCGGAGTATNMVTAVQTGGMLAVTIDETIFHPGHYRVAIAQTMAGLPPDPVITAGGGDPCRTAAIDANPTMPTLADGILAHTAAFSGQQTAMVQLPAGFECTNCVVQVLQYMRNHAAPCFYYHCATVTISNNPVMVDGPPMEDEEAGGCCDAGAPSASWLFGIAAFALILRRRR